MSLVGKVAIKTAIMLVLLATGLLFILYGASQGGINQAQVEEGQEVIHYDTHGRENTMDLWRPDLQAGAESYLLVGADSRQGDNADVGAGGTEISGIRSDTIMVVHIPQTQDRISVISFPRDLSVTRDGCQDWDSTTGSYGSELDTVEDVKINSTFASGGPRCLATVISAMTGLDITRYAAVDFAGFERLVDIVGGVTVSAEEDLVDDVLGHIMDAGEHTLNGTQSLDYVRARSVQTETGSDYSRINRQQNFINSFIREARENGSLSDPITVTSLAKAFISHATVDNIDDNHLFSMVRMVNNMDMGNIEFVTLPTLGPNSNWNEVPDQEQIDDLMESIVVGDSNTDNSSQAQGGY